VVLSPLTINGYGGSCGYREAAWLDQFADTANPPRPAARVVESLREMRVLEDGVQNPYFHLVDGGVSDNLGLRGVLEFLQALEALREAGEQTPLDQLRRIIVFVVNSATSPSLDWNLSDNAPGTLAILLQATGVPIDHYSHDSVGLLKDTDARWAALRAFRDAPEFANVKDPKLKEVVNAPNAAIYVIDVSFHQLKDKSERDYLNQLPTSFVLPSEAVDRLRAAPMTLILESPDFQRMLKEAGAHAVDVPMAMPLPAPLAATVPAAPAAAK